MVRERPFDPMDGVAAAMLSALERTEHGRRYIAEMSARDFKRADAAQKRTERHVARRGWLR